jgi:hypothetical protein
MKTKTKTRPFEKQTLLERVLRSHLQSATIVLETCRSRLPGYLKTHQYQQAANCQAKIIEAKYEIQDWNHILQLYEEERVKK